MHNLILTCKYLCGVRGPQACMCAHMCVYVQAKARSQGIFLSQLPT